MNGGSEPGAPEGGSGMGQEPQQGAGQGPFWPPPQGGSAPGGYGSSPQPGYGAQQPGYGAQQPGYGTPQPGYGAQQPYGGQPPPYGQPYGGAGYGMAPAGSRPPTYLVWGILAAVGGVFFCLIGGVPTAIAATLYARQVNSKWAAGDQQGALQASRNARTWAIVATVLDAIGLILVIVLLAHGVNTTSTGTG